jgi:hypothetical protein
LYRFGALPHLPSTADDAVILQALQEDSHKLPADEQEAGHATPVKNQFQVNLAFGFKYSTCRLGLMSGLPIVLRPALLFPPIVGCCFHTVEKRVVTLRCL